MSVDVCQELGCVCMHSILVHHCNDVRYVDGSCTVLFYNGISDC